MVFTKNTVSLCGSVLEAGFLTANATAFELNISSVVNSNCQSKVGNAQKVLQILGQATNYRMERSNVLAFYDNAKATLRLKFVEKV